ncbi:MAG: beta-N-acetylhexosaminidase [Deltaproteobacteria bacterium]|nr:beta-N-acetylhexosaminidase [Deltaproteobacteria bacterium]MBW1961972.1 beta-N-acetylhexosaminidase [Deltaproteobacteria bacterium]MBW1994101.1 beta-N-acetylhexosaminidase [Deltaproteobacteria bacterium]MBW2152965.1 beta-N-acetylhexosaminidase [Deltaproteobacteria bacterium]
MNVSDFSKQQLAGQRLMVGFEGTALNDDLRLLIKELKVGGVILFKRNIETPDQIRDLSQSIQSCAARFGQPPLFIAVDQEGGEVARLKPPFTQFPGNPSMKEEADASRFAEITATELSDVGINMNMAPVLDIAPKDADSVMARRAFGDDPRWVSRLGAIVIGKLQQKNIMAVAKHFPGIGRTTLDSHLDLPTLNTALELLQETDFLPFKKAIDEDVAGMMISHVRFSTLDVRWPASLSEQTARRLLREQMGFAGVVMTDDLDMGAIENHFPIDTVIAQILNADIDIALICRRSPKIEKAFKEILKHIENNNEMKQRALASAKRILALKTRYLKGAGGL